ncbi:hypothetical protein GLOIN_2v1779779 [Rhizophagus irregularis DAOM 181602=DAOM 197198]|nr:hypothetical protein GLOIN_2v1779779 [Rhizophagus irregularis DAOM 181602=DAOM 197198]
MINLHAATSLAEDLGLDLVDIYGIRKWIQMQASPFNDPDIPSCGSDIKEAEEVRRKVAVERALLRCGFITQESDWEKWTQITYNIQLLKEGRTLDDSDDESDDGEVSLDDSDDEEYF